MSYSFYDVWADLFKIPYERPMLDGSFNIKPEDYMRANGGIVFPNPNAPTGVYLELDNVRKILDSNRDVIVIVDEAYIDFGGRVHSRSLTNTITFWWSEPTLNRVQWRDLESAMQSEGRSL